MSRRIWIATALIAVVLVVASAIYQGGPNNHPIHPVLTYTLIALGEVSNVIGLRRSMFGAIHVGYGVIAMGIAFALYLIAVPAKRKPQ